MARYDLVGIPYHEVYKRELDRRRLPADGRGSQPDPAFAKLFAIARGRVADRQLLRKRPGMAGSERSQDRSDLRAYETIFDDLLA